jgi:hypothetical protein
MMRLVILSFITAILSAGITEGNSLSYPKVSAYCNNNHINYLDSSGFIPVIIPVPGGSSKSNRYPFPYPVGERHDTGWGGIISDGLNDINSTIKKPLLMNIWKSSKWENDKEICSNTRRCGLRFRFQNNVDKNVRRACIEFGKWLRNNYYFPIRVVIYFKSAQYIKSIDGEYVSAIFFEPYNKIDEPYIKIACGDLYIMIEAWGEDSALAAILGSVAHELTHYFQWINDINLTDIGMERQASYYSKKIIEEYSKTREHP